MAESNDPNDQNVSAAFPGEQAENTGALEVNLNADALDIFNPNLALSAVQTFNVLNNIANKMFGIEARWFRSVPQQRSKDVIFQEYTLYCVEETPVCLRVIVPDGNFPESNYQYDLMGLEYNIPTEIQIDKKYWEEMAGFGTAPQKKDIVYLPMPNKLFQVESAFLKRGFMEQETTWVVNLIKFQSEAARKEGDGLKATIDQYTVSEEGLFGDLLNEAMEKITDDRQMSPLSSTSEDKYKEIDSTLEILSYNLDMHGIVVAESLYNMNTSTTFNAITYKNSSDSLTVSDDRAITAWINPLNGGEKPVDVLWIVADDTLTPPANYKIKVQGTTRYTIGDTFVISRSEQMNFYAKVVDDSYSTTGIYWCEVDAAVIAHLNSIQTNWASKRNWKMIVRDPITIMDGINETETGFTVTLNANQYIKIHYGTQEHIAVMDDQLDENSWYGFVINIGNTYDQYNVHVWKPSLLDTVNKLESVFYETLSLTAEATEIDRYTVDKSLSYITNIRLFRSIIEEEKQIPELLSYFTQNADQALILDNADPRFRSPYISQQR